MYIYLFKVFDSFKVESLFVQKLQILIIQLISAHLILLSFLFHLIHTLDKHINVIHLHDQVKTAGVQVNLFMQKRQHVSCTFIRLCLIPSTICSICLRNCSLPPDEAMALNTNTHFTHMLHVPLENCKIR